MADFKPQIKAIPPGQQIPVDFRNAKDEVCECGHAIFNLKYRLKTLSALESPIGQKMTGQEPVWVCDKCGMVKELSK